jgi:hypothetical protein
MNEPNPKATPPAAIPYKEEPPVHPAHDNEVFGNPRSFPFLWKRPAKPSQSQQPQQQEPEG